LVEWDYTDEFRSVAPRTLHDLRTKLE
jgi:hypothetical protein